MLIDILPCNDCGIDTCIDPRDYYMVTASVWNTYGLGGCVMAEDGESWSSAEEGSGGFLCMKCLEDRMGRKLKYEDVMWCGASTMNPYVVKLMREIQGHQGKGMGCRQSPNTP